MHACVCMHTHTDTLTLVYILKTEIRRQSIILFDLSRKPHIRQLKFFLILCMSVKDHNSTVSTGLGVIGKLQQESEFANKESINEDQLHSFILTSGVPNIGCFISLGSTDTSHDQG